MPKLGIVIASTRPNRVGPAVARWFAEKAKAHGKFEIEMVDLKEINLPPLDEPEHPRHQKYQHEHTKAWSRTVNALDAFAFVTPEYNYAMAPALLNALDYLSREWHYKPAAFVSYGGVSGGTRSVQMAKLAVTSLKMMPLPEAVSVPFVMKLIDAQGTFAPGTSYDDAAGSVLNELLRWSEALRSLRNPPPV